MKKSIFKVYTSLLFAIMIIAQYSASAAQTLEFKRDTEAVGDFWKAREKNTVQLFSLPAAYTEEQYKNEFSRLIKKAKDAKNIDLLSYPLFATHVSGEKWGYGAVGVFDSVNDANKFATDLSFLNPNSAPYVRPKAKSSAVTLTFVLYREADKKD